MQLTKYVDIIAMSKELKDKALAPIRARQAATRFDAKLAELEERLLTAETRVHELCSANPIDVDKLIDHLDDIELLKRRMKRVKEIQIQLF